MIKYFSKILPKATEFSEPGMFLLAFRNLDPHTPSPMRWEGIAEPLKLWSFKFLSFQSRRESNTLGEQTKPRYKKRNISWKLSRSMFKNKTKNTRGGPCTIQTIILEKHYSCVCKILTLLPNANDARYDSFTPSWRLVREQHKQTKIYALCLALRTHVMFFTKHGAADAKLGTHFMPTSCGKVSAKSMVCMKRAVILYRSEGVAKLMNKLPNTVYRNDNSPGWGTSHVHKGAVPTKTPEHLGLAEGEKRTKCVMSYRPIFHIKMVAASSRNADSATSKVSQCWGILFPL